MQPAQDQSTLPTALVIFGATGDLARRKLVPAIFSLYQKKMLPRAFRVVGFSRQPLDDAGFRRLVEEFLGPRGSAEERAAFAGLFNYVQGFFHTEEGYRNLAEFLGSHDRGHKVCTNKLFYLAVPPVHYRTVFENLAASGLTVPCAPEEGWTKVAVEKPFGRDLETAKDLDALLAKLYKEEQIYRIDHYLGKETVQNILAFRFSNSILEPIWNRDHIEEISIRLWEPQGVEGRGEFFDATGLLRDVGQNHILQLLALFTMENPGGFDTESVRKKREEAISSLREFAPEEVRDHTLRGQYKNYKSEEGVDLASKTETYFRIKARSDAPRWRGVAINLEGGKMMPDSRAEVAVTFRHPQPCLCPPGRHHRNVLRYEIQPDPGFKTSFWVKRPGSDMVLEERDFMFDYKNAYAKDLFFEAYERLISDALRGDQKLFVSTNEVFHSWRFIDPILKAWTRKDFPLHEYASHEDLRELKHEGERMNMSRTIGYVGLGKMGLNMVHRLVRHGWAVHATDVNPEAVRAAEALTGGGKAYGHADMKSLVAALPSPRVIWLMIPSKDPQVVEDVIFGPDGLASLLERGDLIIDGGNSFYEHAVERAQKLRKQGIRFMDIGTSGGPGGALEGACLMIGGEENAYAELEPLFKDLAAPGAYAYCGKAGGGHFTKMIHNGIEYGMMQSLAEGFEILKKSEFAPDLEKVADLYNHRSVIESRLVGWLVDAYRKFGTDLEGISGTVGHTGEGEWTVKVGRELGVPTPAIEDAFKFRVESAKRPSYAGQVLSALRLMFGGHQDAKAKPEEKK